MYEAKQYLQDFDQWKLEALASGQVFRKAPSCCSYIKIVMKTRKETRQVCSLMNDENTFYILIYDGMNIINVLSCMTKEVDVILQLNKQTY